jgi:hypothetical protein
VYNKKRERYNLLERFFFLWKGWFKMNKRSLQYYFDDEEKNRICGIFFSQCKFIPNVIKYSLGQRDIWEDLEQELYMLALLYPSVDIDKEYISIRRYASRCIYYFLKRYGFHKKRNVSGYIEHTSESDCSDFLSKVDGRFVTELN